MVFPMSTKICPTCDEEKPIENFRWKNKVRGIRISYCQSCDKARRASRYAAQRVAIQAINTKSRLRRLNLIATKALLVPNTRRCVDCLQEKPAGDFRWKNQSLGLRVARCTVCDAVYRADKYDGNKPPFMENNKRQHRKLRSIVNGAKNGPCLDCGRAYPPYVMDFDHRDPSTKIAKVSAMVYKGSEPLLRAEIAKCDLICSNCHRIRTHQGKHK